MDREKSFTMSGEFYRNGEIWVWPRIASGGEPMFVRMATEREVRRQRYLGGSGPLQTMICCACRGKLCRDQTGAHFEHHFRVGWRFEYPKKRDIKGWKAVEAALKENDPTNIWVRRARGIVDDSTDSELFSWAHMYHHGDDIVREKKPRHRPGHYY